MRHISTFYISLITGALLLFVPQNFAQGFLSVNGTKFVNQYGQEVFLKGMGLGGWLEPEGYMFGMSAFANSPSQIQKKIQDLIGVSNTNDFYSAFRKNFVTESDIKALASWGFNLVRLPFHYNILTPADSPGVYSASGFAILDSLITWCSKYHIYVILDLHCAPGGESDQTISDYDPSVPSLWQDTAKQTRTVELWKTIAERYKNEPTVAGYDLLNEPRWNFTNGNKPLHDLYVRITNAIRSVDTTHILFIEGNQYATDFSGLTPPWDKKMAYSFHKYWNANNAGAIQGYLNLRSTYNVPLWLGESGENSNTWYTECISLMKQYDISWSWWTLKKFNTINAPLNVPYTPDYQQLLNYWQGSGTKPSVTFAYYTLLRMADNLKFENCVFQKDVVDAMIRQPEDNTTVPYTGNNIPGIVYASDYDMGKLNFAYNDTDYENNGGSQSSWNSGWSYRNDGVDIEPCGDFPSNGYDVGWINTGEWMNYTVNIAQAGTYNIEIRYASNQAGGQFVLRLDGNIISSVISVPVTGGWQNWQTMTLQNIQLPAGSHVIKAQFLSGGFNLNYFLFDQIATGIKSEKKKEFTFRLDQNYPNPFSAGGGSAFGGNPSTVIRYSVPGTVAGALLNNPKSTADEFVSLKVYDLLGNLVATLVNEYQQAGEHEAVFNPGSLASGIYFCRLSISQDKSTQGNYTSIKKMILLR